ncbi:toll/interleukin-1 receptor domain-containing protein [Rhizobacter sp. SG703]|uniref:toll/interleukin-1 receptor domain-containing protein n=1 Tax=Rhizobacter sp. SG703 TaxID=2587140 RepID=UPI0014480775|nr:toll/interleukin-1 receptor domain-containing protein [Rhizobacter sp. SG703]NKI95468.1 tetratricopeptide (TPR) repeat protein [Rhizobacter sp. SG703]
MNADETPATASPVPAPRYGAFISYSHHDKVAARRLQRQLETYRIPRRLLGRATPHGPVPARLPPLFRDRDELNAGADLKASVQEALAASRWLIVVCSPDAARSPWVNREIIEFKRLHGEGRVLALIARGEPFASNTPGREASECFPPALRFALTPDGRAEGEPLEPIAADQRAEGDGPRRAALKLLAGMIGVGFDDLVQRDTQRRLRWLAAIATASAVGVVVFALLAVLAVRARNEAQHQRAQAEGLIEFMLGDLRKKLEPVGRLEVLDSVGEKALAYYAEQHADRLDATALGHRSRAMHLIGEIRDLRGNAVEAQAAFEQAAATTRQLLLKAPGDGQRIFDHAQSVFWVGYAAWKHLDGRAALARFQEYLALAQRLVALDSANLDWRAEVAFAHVNIGGVQLGMGRPSDALASLRQADELLRELAPKRPEFASEWAQNHGWLAETYAALGDYEHALREQQEKLALHQRMADSSKSRVAQRSIQNALNIISFFELALGRPHDAELHSRAGLKMADNLVLADASNMLWLGDACFARLRLIETLVAQSRHDAAREELTAATACVDKFLAGEARDARYAVGLRSRLLELTAQVVQAPGRGELISKLQALLASTDMQAKGDAHLAARQAVEISGAAAALAVLAEPDRRDVAQQAWKRVESALAPFAAMDDGAVLTPLARARLGLGDVKGAQALATRIEKTTYRHPAYAELARRLQTARGGSSHTSN